MAFIYSDLNAFTPTDAALLTDEEAVYQALITLFSASPGERLFQPEFGVDLDDSLFELISQDTALQLYDSVISAIERWEPRVKVDNSRTIITPFEDENRYELDLYFSILGISDQVFQFRGSFTK